jgi:hypothetical protein
LGLGPIFTPRITRAVYRGQSPGASSVTLVIFPTAPPFACGLAAGVLHGSPYSTPTSRATPMCPKQSARLLVTSRSIIASSKHSKFRPDRASLFAISSRAADTVT